jgi:hypothetical protein
MKVLATDLYPFVRPMRDYSFDFSASAARCRSCCVFRSIFSVACFGGGSGLDTAGSKRGDGNGGKDCLHLQTPGRNSRNTKHRPTLWNGGTRLRVDAQ